MEDLKPKDKTKDLPTIFVITPTFSRPVQKGMFFGMKKRIRSGVNWQQWPYCLKTLFIFLSLLLTLLVKNIRKIYLRYFKRTTLKNKIGFWKFLLLGKLWIRIYKGMGTLSDFGDFVNFSILLVNKFMHQIPIFWKNFTCNLHFSIQNF